MAYTTIEECKAEYALAKRNGDAAGMQRANSEANKIRAAQGQSAEYAAGDIASVSKANAGKAQTAAGLIETGRQQWNENSKSGLSAGAKATDASVQKTILNLEAQKDKLRQTQKDNNTAAYEAWMRTINDYGAAQEALAARGLQASGLSESSKISAGNTYQNALNQNARSLAQQLADIDLAVEQARLDGDLTKAQQLTDYYNAVAAMSYTAAGDKASAMQADRSYDRSVLESDRAFDYETSLANAAQLADMGDFSGYQKLYGWTDAQMQAARANWLARQNPVGTSSAGSSVRRSGGSSGRSSGSVSRSSGNDPVQNLAAEEAALDSVQNLHDGETVYVNGFGRISWAKLAQLIESGQIKEAYNKDIGKYVYSKTSQSTGTGAKQQSTGFAGIAGF